MRFFDLLVIIALVVFWYGLIPMVGAIISRHTWRMFRRRFNELRLKPQLDYGIYRRSGEEEAICRFTGDFESITDGHTLWLRSEDLTLPVALAKAQTYMLPAVSRRETPPSPAVPSPALRPSAGVHAGEDPELFEDKEEIPERIRWNRISTLTRGTKVFVGGSLMFQDQRKIFVSTRKNPLLVIFYDGSDRSFPLRTIRAGRHRNEYWNLLTPYSLILGAFFQLALVLGYISRPAFLLTVLTALIALFTPILPLFPPGLLCTLLYRRFWGTARLFRARRDLARLPLKHIPLEERTSRLSSGEIYGAVYLKSLPELTEEQIPIFIRGSPGGWRKHGWYVFGALSPALVEKAAPLNPAEQPEPVSGEDLPTRPSDTFAIYGAIPGDPETLARRYARDARKLEILAWLMLLAGIGLNVFFIQIIVSLLF